MAAHMVVAAYLVGGFLIASVYAVGMLRGRRDRYHRLGLHHRVHRRSDRDPDPDGRRRRAGALGVQRAARRSSPRSRWCRDEQRRARDAVRPPELPGSGGRRASRSPGSPRSCPTPVPAPAPWSRAWTRSRPTTGRPCRRSTSSHLAWDIMVGLGTLLFLLTLWYWAAGSSGETCPRAGGSSASRDRRRALRDHAGGRLDGERGRPAALDRLREDEGRGRRDGQHRGLDHVHRGRPALRRPRDHHDPGAAWHESPLPRDGSRASTSPTCPTARAVRPTSSRCRSDEHRRRRHPVRGDHDVRRSSAAPTSAPASGTSSRAAPSAASVPAR